MPNPDNSYFCSKHTTKYAADKCSKCKKSFCADCLRIENGKLFCNSCARILVPINRLYACLFPVAVTLGVICLFASSSGGLLGVISFFSGLIMTVCGFILRKKSFDGLPPKISSDEGYSLYMETKVIHTPSYDGHAPFPSFDLRGNPLVDVTDVILSGSSEEETDNNAQISMKYVEVCDQVWLKQARKNQTSIYAENKYGHYLGWIPEIRRYRSFRDSLVEIFADPLHGSVLASVVEKTKDEDGRTVLQIAVARYYTP